METVNLSANRTASNALCFAYIVRYRLLTHSLIFHSFYLQMSSTDNNEAQMADAEEAQPSSSAVNSAEVRAVVGEAMASLQATL